MGKWVFSFYIDNNQEDYAKCLYFIEWLHGKREYKKDILTERVKYIHAENLDKYTEDMLVNNV